jgi:hypothetical protein
MLEFCRAIVIAPTPFETRCMTQDAIKLGFGRVSAVFNEDDTVNRLFRVTYFLIHHRMPVADYAGIIASVRNITSDGFCYSPIIVLGDGETSIARKFIGLGLDDAIDPETDLKLKIRLESQMHRDITYYRTRDYLGPERRVANDASLRRPIIMSPHTRLVIRRSPEAGSRVISRDYHGYEHFENVQPMKRPYVPEGLIAQARTFGRRLLPPVVSY